MKAAVIDTPNGTLATKRYRLDTPRPATPQPMAEVFERLLGRFDWKGPVGCAFPGVVLERARIATAANLDESWLGVDASALFGSHSVGSVTMVNDADAAGIAEMHFGAGRGVPGLVVTITIGTGLGTALFYNGQLIPNSELGHIEIDGSDAEQRASGRALKVERLDLHEWATRFDRYLRRVEDLLWPDLFILGGGVSKEFEDFGPVLSTRTPVRAAELRNYAGVVGAAIAATTG